MSDQHQKSEINFQALKLEAGCTYAVECEENLSFEQIERMLQSVKTTGCKFVILGKGMKIARHAE